MGYGRGRGEADLTSLWCAFRPTSALSGRERTLLATTYSGLPPSCCPPPGWTSFAQVCTPRLAHRQFCICLLTDRQIVPTSRARPFYHHPFQAFLSRKSMSRRSHSTHFSTRISGRSPKRGIVVTRVNGRPQVGQRRRSCSFIALGPASRPLTSNAIERGRVP
jgi:hypothetical protein